MSTTSDDQNFLSFSTEINNKKWLIYWKNVEESIGVTDGENELYELDVDRKDRKKFAGNVADSLLDRKWKTIFDGKHLQISKTIDDSIELRYIRNTLTLPKIEEDLRMKLRDMIFLQQEAIAKLTSSLHSVLEPGRRKRGLPTGLQFED